MIDILGRDFKSRNSKIVTYIASELMEYMGIKSYKPILDEKEFGDMKEIAEYNGVLPILKEVDSSDDSENRCDETRMIIRNTYKSRLEMAKPIFEEFEKEQIAYAVLKGAYLGDVAYGEMGLRSSNDIDMLINKKDIKRVKEICLRNGFVPGKSDRENKCIIHYDRVRELAFTLNTHQIATMVKTGKNEFFDYYDTVLDCNFSLFWGGYKNDTLVDVFLENTVKICDSNGYEYFVLKPEYFLLQLCLHAYKEAKGIFFIKSRKAMSLRGFSDIYYYIIKHEKTINWICIREIIEKNNLNKFIYFIFVVLDRLFEPRESIREMIKAIEKEEIKESINEIGLDREISCKEIPLEERFVKGAFDELIDNNISEGELDRLKMAEEEFY